MSQGQSSATPAPADARERLTRTSVALHWIVAISMIAMLVFGFYLDGLERGDAKTALLALHKSVGSLLLFVVLLRLWWRLRQGALEPLGDHPRWLEVAARASHHFLLFATIAMPITGIIRSVGRGRAIEIFGLPFIPQLLTERNEIISTIGSLGHEIVAYAAAAVIAVHAAAALKHHFIDRDGTLRRMLGGTAG